MGKIRAMAVQWARRQQTRESRGLEYFQEDSVFNRQNEKEPIDKIKA